MGLMYYFVWFLFSTLCLWLLLGSFLLPFFFLSSFFHLYPRISHAAHGIVLQLLTYTLTCTTFQHRAQPLSPFSPTPPPSSPQHIIPNVAIQLRVGGYLNVLWGTGRWSLIYLLSGIFGELMVRACGPCFRFILYNLSFLPLSPAVALSRAASSCLPHLMTPFVKSTTNPNFPQSHYPELYFPA
jgi:hypothetical protein